jgi:hypothetical protein
MIDITYDFLGGHGQLGNQMFQYALLVGVKHKIKNCNIKIDPETKNRSYLFKFFDLKECTIEPFQSPILYNEKHFFFDEDVFNINQNTNFRGYYQTDKYFKHCSNTVRQEFTFKRELQSQVDAFLEQFRGKYLVSVHVRRGDYLVNPEIHTFPGIEYYSKAMEHLDNGNTVFICTSDDKAWCEQNFNRDNLVCTSNDLLYDMCLISKCNSHIIANSTFSWWGSWLGTDPDKKVIAPSVWFGPKSKDYLQTKDIYCDNFTVI